jgi:two-component system chemotaxis sensor kinase CheA
VSDTAEYRELFVAEAQENLQALSDGALKLERSGEGKEAVDGLFRAAHTLKGMSATMGFEGLTRVCHSMEDALDAVRSGASVAGPELSDALLAAVDAMTGMLGDVAGGGDGGLPDAGLLARFKGLGAGDPEGDAAPVREPAPGPAGDLPLDDASRRAVVQALADAPAVFRLTVRLEPTCAFKGVRAVLVCRALEGLAHVIATRPAGPALEAGAFGPDFDLWTEGGVPAPELEHAVLRVLEVAEVRVVPVDAVAGAEAAPAPGPGAGAYVGPEPVAEALVAPVDGPQEAEFGAGLLPGTGAEPGTPHPAAGAMHQTVRVSVERLDKVLDLVGELVTAKIRLSQIARGGSVKDLGEALIQVDHIVNELQQEVTAARMVPMDQIFSRFPRLIRDLSRDMGKPMDLVLEGREIELDRSILDEISEALVHLLRNAADHGIEEPGRRSAAGKPATGTIRLEARRDKNHVVISVEDDGAGIDTARVRQVAVDRGLLGAEAARLLSEDEALALIFSPGFSTASRVTRLSGRGVGIDAVRTKAEALGGSLRVDNFPGRGARFRIRVPLTLAIIRALKVRVGGEHYMAPLANVVEAVEYSEGEFRSNHGMRTVKLRDEILPLRRLDELLGLDRPGPGPGLLTVLVVEAGERRVGLVVDEVLGQQEIAIKNLGRGLKSVRGFGGVTILGDGSVCLILDLPSLLDI